MGAPIPTEEFLVRRSLQKTMSLLAAAVFVGAAAVFIGSASPAAAAADPSFKVTCYPRGMAQNDPIVFPGQAGRSHMHSFYGAKGVDENTTVDSLLAQPSSQCGGYFDTVDLSAYWIPTLYQNGVAKHTETGAYQLHAYYQRAGGPGGALVDQAFPRGLRMIAGDMRATTPQDSVSYVCANAEDTGSQRGGGHEFMSCGSDEVFVAKLVFPDCWDGVNLDSADHKSHMAYSSGPSATCPSDHPVKLPRLTFEAWYFGVNGDASAFAWASGGAYTFHGDVISAWDTRAAANLVNQCINEAFDCNPLIYPNIPQGEVTQAQIDAQFAGVMSPAPAPTDAVPVPTGGESGHAEHSTPTPTPTATASPGPSPTTTRSPAPPRHRHGATETAAATLTAPPGGDSPAGPITLIGVACAVLTAVGLVPMTLLRRRRR